MFPLRITLQACWYALFPFFLLLLPQAIYVKKTTLRLPEASGDNHIPFQGFSAHSAHVSHFGESTVAGVGIQKLHEGLSANICQRLHDQLSMNIHCHISGKNGICYEELNALIATHPHTTDVAIITMGVNDTTKLTPLSQWRKQIELCITQLQQQGTQHIFFTQVPPMAQFPALPAPLKYFLGLRAWQLDLELKRITQNQHRCHYVGSKLLVEKHYMAEDGYHPSAQGYAAWAEQISPQIVAKLKDNLTV